MIKNMKLQQLTENYTIKFSKKVNDAIRFFCKKINKTEWSGVVFYKKTKDTITVQDILLMSIDSPSLTEFNWKDPKILDYQVEQDLIDCYMGSLHSHHGMQVTPSQTDWEDVESQTKKGFPDGYLFLIVNNANDLTAIYSTVGSITTVFKGLSLQEKPIKHKIEEDYVFYNYCKRPEVIADVTDKYIERLEEVETIVKARVPVIRGVQKFVPKNVASNPDIHADVRKIYWQLFKQTTEYLISKHDPESFMEAYINFYGEVYDNITDRINIIKRVIAYAETLNKTKFVNELIKDYTEWLTILESGLVGQNGQVKHDTSFYWD